MSRYRLAVDTGGTFTDFCLLGSDGRLHVTKVPSTPDDPSRAVVEGIKEVLREKGVHPRQVDLVLHGTTVATNAILEGKGARLALITTRGFRDVIFIGRQNRPHLYNFWAVKPRPPLPRRLVLEVDERILADGSVARPLREEEVDAIAERVVQSGVEAVAVCLLHAYANPAHELLLKDALEKKIPGLLVSVSSEVLPEFREYERTSTTVVTALVRPVVDRYVGKLERELEGAGVGGSLYIMQSNGGVITPAQARKQSARTVLSGPAGGVLAGVYLGRLTGYKNLITADMGGTSMDVCLVHNGEPRFTTEGSVAGHPLRLPMLDIHTIGAGGGSIAWIDAGGALRVGPQSAGAVPGPACYGFGGQEPTVTDANLVLGRLGAADFAGGKTLQRELAARCIAERVARPLGLTLEAAAEGIIRVVNASMAGAIRVVSVQKGYDPRDFTLVAFGGAGPLHAVELARELGIPRILVPLYPGVTSAWGMLAADVRHDYSLTCVMELNPGAGPALDDRFAALLRRGREDLLREGFKETQVTLARLVDIRYKGQSYELTLPVPGRPLGEGELISLAGRFHRMHRKHYGYCRENAPLEIVTLRLVATGRLPKMKPPSRKAGREVEAVGTRRVYLAGAPQDVPVYHRRQVGPGWEVDGPAIISQADSTTLIWPGDRARCDRWGNIIIETAGR
ncbi:MAG: hydantoinase/oxoprolinase family protein [Bacillota bacterium]